MLLLIMFAVSFYALAAATPQPIIYDTDHGPFIDDIFALGLLLNSRDLIDMKVILTTSEQPDLSAICVSAQLFKSEVSGIPVAMGETLPPYEDRGGVCAVPGLLGFGIEPECREVYETTEEAGVIEDGVAYAAKLIEESGRDDWWYILVGGQTSLKRLIEEYPEAASKIETLIIMAGNWCSGFDPYPDVSAPTDETNIGCDPQAANYVLDGRNIVFPNVYYVPVVVADVIEGEDYARFVEAATSGTQPIANATLEFYQIWSTASRANEDLLVHAEAMTYDPLTESVPQFDAVAVMLALELLSMEKDSTSCGGDGRLSAFQFEAVHFLQNDDPGLAEFPDTPRSSFSLRTDATNDAVLPEQCPGLTEFTFDPDDTPEAEYPILATLGFVSLEAKEAVYKDMASRLAGEYTLCGVNNSVTDSISDIADNISTDTASTPVPNTPSTLAPTLTPVDSAGSWLASSMTMTLVMLLAVHFFVL